MTKPAKNLLFCCNQGQNRSRETCRQITLAAAKRGWAIETQVAGIHSEQVPLTPALMSWCDVIFLHEEGHLQELRGTYPQDMHRARCILIPVPDVYDFGSEVLTSIVARDLKKNRRLEFLDEVLARTA